MVDVSPVPKTKSRTLSDVFGSAEVSSRATTAPFARRSIRGPSSMSKHLSPSVAKVLSADARTRCPSSVMPATAMHNAYWSVA
jgi:hypothetical protein